MPKPRKYEYVRVVDEAERHLASMFGRWFDGIPAQVRAELRQLGKPLLEILLAEGLRAEPMEKRYPPD
jgi:hypothetical protein